MTDSFTPDMRVAPIKSDELLFFYQMRTGQFERRIFLGRAELAWKDWVNLRKSCGLVFECEHYPELGPAVMRFHPTNPRPKPPHIGDSNG